MLSDEIVTAVIRRTNSRYSEETIREIISTYYDCRTLPTLLRDKVKGLTDGDWQEFDRAGKQSAQATEYYSGEHVADYAEGANAALLAALTGEGTP